MNARARTLFAAALIASSALPSVARADDGPWLFSLGGGAALPVTDSQARLFGVGAELHAGAALPFGRHVAFGVSLFGGLLSDGPAPEDTNRVDPGVGSWLGAGLSMTLRPLGDLEPQRRATGLLLTFEAGGVSTGGVFRPALVGAIGWGLGIDDTVLVPEIRVLHVVQFDDPLDDGQGVVVSAGLSVVWGDVPTVPPGVEPPPSEPSDRDGDGLDDVVDACPDVAEDFDGLDDEDGCPEDDVDGDGVFDEVDACVREPEDLDGLGDADGCPEDDFDADHIADETDACPELPEVVNGVEDADGCPDAGEIELVGDRVVLDERVLFDTARARVHHAAWPLLEAIATMFLTHPEWGVMRVEGHADVRGRAAFNEWLSTERAERVRELLIEYGVPADRIEIAGYGASRPRTEGDTAAAHADNRRVEFVMVPAPPSPAVEGGSP